MDSNNEDSSSQSSRGPPQDHKHRTSSTQDLRGHGDTGSSRAGEALKRGHSDGDVLAARVGEGRRASQNAPGTETMRSVTDSGQDDSIRAQLAASRVAMTNIERRRRHAEQQESQFRRRTLSLTHSNSQSSHRPASGEDDNPFRRLPPPPQATGPTLQRNMNRPLPRLPHMNVSQNWRMRDPVLPTWQPDAEASKCPICETKFGFWYRKHHCRKCGRVVCANCSPHRITIPRQFIVHPPEEASTSPIAATSGVEVVDLTGDNTSSDEDSHPTERPQSSDYRINPALGGGQEVRLCNPCVPDPNPLPHLPFSPSTSSSYESFPGAGRRRLHHHHPSRPDPNADQRPQSGAGRNLPGALRTRHESLSALDGSMASREPFPFDYPDMRPPATHRHSHAPRPMIPPPPSLPSYSTMYGSAPHQNTSQVSNLPYPLPPFPL